MMLTIQQVRAKYPQYKDMSDIQLADKLHAKYYSDIPREEFFSKVNAFKKIDFDGEQKERSFTSKLLPNIATGVTQAGHQLINAPHNLAGLISKSLADKIPKQEEFDYASAYGLPKEATTTDKIIRGIAQFAPGLAVPATNLGRVGTAISSIPKAGKFLGAAIPEAISQGLFGATQTDNPLEGAAAGSIGSFAGSTIGKALESSLKAVRPSNLLRSKLSPKELERNLKITKGTKTNLGNVIEDPYLSKLYENVLPTILGSGADKTMGKVAEDLVLRGTNIYEKIAANTKGEDYGRAIQNALKEASKEATIKKNNMYSEVNELASKHNVLAQRNNFKNKAEEILSDINDNPELSRELPSSLVKDIETYATNSKETSLKAADIFRSKLNEKASQFYKEGKKYESSLLKNLKGSLEKDIEDAFANSGKPEIQEARKEAHRRYKEEFAPFEDKDIIKFTKKGADSDLILNHFLKKGINDRSNLLKKLTDKLEDKEGGVDLIRTAFLNKAVGTEGKINPQSLSTIWKGLGKNQKEVLFNDPRLRNELSNYVSLVNKNKESLNLMFNPKTGNRNAIKNNLPGLSIGIPKLALGLAASAAGSRVLNKALTSEKVREKLVKAMIKDKNSRVWEKQKPLAIGRKLPELGSIANTGILTEKK